MPLFISNSELQKNPGLITKKLGSKSAIITTHGKPTMVLLPYFEENDDLIAEYLEDFEMWQNREKLQKKYKKSLESGISSLKV